MIIQIKPMNMPFFRVVKLTNIISFLPIIILLTLLQPYQIIFVSIAIIFLFLYLIFGEKIIIILSIVSFLTLTESIDVNLRFGVQAINFILLLFLFFKNFGFKISGYPSIPKLLRSLIICIFFAMIFSTIFSNHVFLGIEQIVRLFIFFLIVYFIYSLLQQDNDIKILLISLVIVSLIYSMVMFIELADNNFNLVLLNQNQIEKVSVSYINWNTVGALINLVFPILFSIYFVVNKRIIKKVILCCLMLTLFGLFVSNSRASILGLLISILFLLYHIRRKTLIRLAIILLVLIPLLLLLPIVSDYLNIYFRIYRLTSGRDIIWSTIIKVISENPIIGYGPAASKFAFYNHLTVLLGSPEERLLSYHLSEIEFGHAHNFYMFLWSDLGLLGLFTSAYLPYVFFKLGFYKLKSLKIQHCEYYYIKLGIIASGIGIFIRSIFEWSSLISYGTIKLDLPFWLIMILLCYINLHVSQNDNNSNVPMLKSG